MAPFKGPRDKGNQDVKDLKFRRTVFAHLRGSGPLKWMKRSISDFRSIKKGQDTVSRFTNAIKIARKRVICSPSIRFAYCTVLLLLHLLWRIIMPCTAELECKIPAKTPARGQSTGHRAAEGAADHGMVCVACKTPRVILRCTVSALFATLEIWQ